MQAAVRISVNLDDNIQKTIDLFTGLGEIILVNSNPPALGADYNRIRELEKESLSEF